MSDEETELEKHLQLLHMLAQVFSIDRNEPIVPYSPPPTYEETAPSRPPTSSRFTALKAKLEANNKENSQPTEASDGISD